MRLLALALLLDNEIFRTQSVDMLALLVGYNHVDQYKMSARANGGDRHLGSRLTDFEPAARDGHKINYAGQPLPPRMPSYLGHSARLPRQEIGNTLVCFASSCKL
jgi:hypothetical protein